MSTTMRAYDQMNGISLANYLTLRSAGPTPVMITKQPGAQAQIALNFRTSGRSRRASATTSAVGPAIQSSHHAASSALTCEGVTAHGVESFRPTSARLRERGAMRNADLSRKQQGGASRHSGKLEELFVEELTRLQPKPGFMRLVKDRVMHAWRELKTDAAQ